MRNIAKEFFTTPSPSPLWSYLAYTCCATSLLTLPFLPDVGRDLFYLSGYFAFFCFLFNFKFYTQNKKNLILPALFLTLSFSTIFWLIAYKKPGDYINIYRSYMNMSRLFIATAFVLLLALNERLKLQRKVIYFCIAAGIVINLYAFYQSIALKLIRIELGFDRATIVAYILTAISLIMMQSILMLKIRHRLVFYALAFMFSYAAIVFTGTRAAMLLYPLLLGISVLATKNVISHRHKIAIILLLPLLLAACGFIFKDKIAKRIEDAQRNFVMLNTAKADNSIFSRVWMQIIALRTGNDAPFGQSAESRAKEALAIIAEEPKLYNAKRYLNVHMHNEVLETYSLKGIWGVVILLAIYLTLLVHAFRPERNAMLLGVSAAMIFYGLSDVLFFSSEATIIFSLAIIFSVLSLKNTQEPANE
ncbi:O-antigen ligase family protein [Erwiniaceae bacterium CAU 1747]